MEKISFQYESRKTSPTCSDDSSSFLNSEKNINENPSFHVHNKNMSSTNSLLSRCLELDSSSKNTSDNSVNTVQNIISKLTNEFYSSHRKNLFFKKNQKIECAEFVTNRVSLDELIKNTIYTLPNTNSIFFDYPLFKCYGTSENYKPVVNYLLSEINSIISKNGSFNIHVNLLSFTMSAAERYTQAIQMFCNECFKNMEIKYIDSMDTMFIYNTPNMISAISSALIRFTNESIKEKMVYYTK